MNYFLEPLLLLHPPVRPSTSLSHLDRKKKNEYRSCKCRYLQLTSWVCATIFVSALNFTETKTYIWSCRFEEGRRRGKARIQLASGLCFCQHTRRTVCLTSADEWWVYDTGEWEREGTPIHAPPPPTFWFNPSGIPQVQNYKNAPSPWPFPLLSMLVNQQIW